MTEQKRFRIGNQTAWFAGSITEPFEYAVSNGFDAFEWFPDKKEGGEGWQEEDLPKETRVYIKDMAAANDIRLSVHVPWRWSPFQPESQREMGRALSLAEDIGAVVMNIHFYKEHGAAAFAEAIGPLIDKLSQKGISLSLENTTETSPEDFNELFRLLGVATEGENSRVGMCLDIGHANLCAVTRNDYIRYIDLLDGDLPIIHVHLHENYGDSDKHLPLFTGPSAKDDSGIRVFIDRMKGRGFSGSLILEQWPDPRSLINEARDRLRSIIGTSPEVAEISKPAIPQVDFERVIAEADKKNRSWREKLRWISGLFSLDAPDLTLDQLVCLAIYLRFLSTGQVKVSEDGSHYRPSHHARMAQDIFVRLRRMETPENFFVLRKIYPWLPSFDSDYLRPEPLTRIRDIAHRNDIPQDLKREIKTTLQNKLHRNAGPEDLETSSRLLERITAPGTVYPSSFVEEFRRFHSELKEFFNASSLDERLTAIAAISGEKDAGIIRHFLDTKASAETAEDLTEAIGLLTELRRNFVLRMSGKEDSAAQQLLAADIGLEDFSFVLLSRIIEALRSQKTLPWQSALRCLGLVVQDMEISAFDTEECLAIASEIEAWRHTFDEEDRNQLMRMKATVDRCLRLAGTFTHKILSLFPEKAERLGHALGVDRQAINVFAESEIRSHPLFQLSRLAALLLKEIRKRAALPPWDIIVPGRVTGRMEAASDLASLDTSPDGPVIAVLAAVEGDEEIPAPVGGIVVPHETPHLSHLAVRARQAGVVFAACEDENIFSGLHDLNGKTVTFDAGDESVRYTVSKGPPQRGRKQDPVAAVAITSVDKSGEIGLVEISRVNLETGGGKAFGARRLQDISAIAGAGFKTPRGAIIPFGAMEESLKRSAGSKRRYESMVSQLDHAGTGEMDDLLGTIKKIVRDVELPKELSSDLQSVFPPEMRLVVRSSSNCEDVEGMSGAGLYETVANVLPECVEDAVRAVWASLWSRNAVSNRQQFGISQNEARMAILFQEMVAPDYSFIIHTVNPVTGKPDEVYIELAAGFGETLASGKVPGTPYRMVCDKGRGSLAMLSFASFSRAYAPGPPCELLTEVVDYSARTLSTDDGFRTVVGRRLLGAALLVEKNLGRPQDIEGAISGGEIYLVQSRPQQGIS